MDQLADLLRARTSGAGGSNKHASLDGVRALLACLDEAGGGTAYAAANAETATTTSFGVDVAIHGPGAAGSTHLANFLHREAGLRCNLLVDPDGSRHAPWPPPPPSPPSSAAPAPQPPCLIYLYSDDPLLGVASFFRRGIAAEQALKTTGAAALASAPAGVDQHETKERARAALRLAANGGFPQTLDAFLERGEDLFGLDAHLAVWLTLPAASDVLFLRYEGAFDEQVARALFSRLLMAARARRRRRDEGDDGGDGVEAEAERLAREWCAQRRDRRTQLTAEQRSKGERLFASYSSRVAALPRGGCFVRPADPAAAGSKRSMDEWEAL